MPCVEGLALHWSVCCRRRRSVRGQIWCLSFPRPEGFALDHTLLRKSASWSRSDLSIITINRSLTWDRIGDHTSSTLNNSEVRPTERSFCMPDCFPLKRCAIFDCIICNFWSWSFEIKVCLHCVEEIYISRCCLTEIALKHSHALGATRWIQT